MKTHLQHATPTVAVTNIITSVTVIVKESRSKD